MTKLKCLSMCLMIWVLISCADIEARPLPRPLKQLTIARRALEAQFGKEKTTMDQNDHSFPARVSPGGPDPHHHFKRV